MVTWRALSARGVSHNGHFESIVRKRCFGEWSLGEHCPQEVFRTMVIWRALSARGVSGNGHVHLVRGFLTTPSCWHVNASSPWRMSATKGLHLVRGFLTTRSASTVGHRQGGAGREPDSLCEDCFERENASTVGYQQGGAGREPDSICEKCLYRAPINARKRCFDVKRCSERLWVKYTYVASRPGISN